MKRKAKSKAEASNADCSSHGHDTNIFLLPGTKNKKKKVTEKECVLRGKAASSKNEDERKMKRLQEKRNRAALEAKSLYLLKKHAIRDDVYPLLFSSGTIGQNESRRKRSVRAANFSKAGLKLYEDAKACSNKISDKLTDDENDGLQKQTLKSSCMLPNEGNQSKDNGGISMMCQRIEVVESITLKPIPELQNTCAIDWIAEMQPSSSSKSCTQNAEETSSVVGQMNSIVHSSTGGPTVVHVSRPSSVEKEREGLPIVMMEQEIMEAINGNSTVIICGETGCGKTTQVPQFLYEGGYGLRGKRIGVTLPRRVAVLATAKRVSHELSLSVGKEVGYQVRHEKRMKEDCSIKFMTDGILLRELQSDLLLKQYSVIILDEAHERSLNTDILVGMLSRVVWLRQKIFMEQQEKVYKGMEINPETAATPLKLILMSATLRVEDFVSDRRLFHEPPLVLEVPTRQYPVTVHFSKKVDYRDYLKQASKKVLRIHRALPPGGILVFVTGKAEVEYLCRKLRREASQSETSTAAEDITSILNNSIEEPSEVSDSALDEFVVEDDEDSYSSDSEEEMIEEPNSVLELLNEPERLASLKAKFDAITTGANVLPEQNLSVTKETSEKSRDMYSGLWVLPLYAMLPSDDQLRVFGAVPEGQRLVVVATNVAETSLTIPGIKYVVDTGREKVKNYNYRNGMASYEVKWISKASAAQRAGRAGRTGPGHCYRLYSSAIFSNVFPDFPSPEISKVPVAGVVLLMKSMGIKKVENFPFPTPPLPEAFTEAEQCLKALEGVDSEGSLTPIGREMARYPMSPRHSRMILSFIRLLRRHPRCSRANLVLGYAVASAAALSFHSPFIYPSKENDDNCGQHDKRASIVREIRKQREVSVRFRSRTSDSLTVSYLLQLFDSEVKKVRKEDFCQKNSLHFKTMDEMSKLRRQLLELIFHLGGAEGEFSWCYGTVEDVESAWHLPPGDYPLFLEEEELLCQAILAGWADRVAKRARSGPKPSEKDRRAKATRYQSCALSETVFLHPSSSVSHTPPDFLVYTEMLSTKRPYLHGVTAVKSEWLVEHARALCDMSPPLPQPAACYDSSKDQVFCWVSPVFGPHLWQLPLHGMPAKDEMVRVSVFASALLEGQVLPCLMSAQKYLVASPGTILKPECLGQSRVFNLLKKLKVGGVVVDCRAGLCRVWRKNPLFLRPEILCWFHEEFWHLFDELWQKMHEEILLDGEQLFLAKKKKRKSEKKRTKL
ncbi:RNA helicase family protein [Wolffia australiana]